MNYCGQSFPNGCEMGYIIHIQDYFQIIQVLDIFLAPPKIYTQILNCNFIYDIAIVLQKHCMEHKSANYISFLNSQIHDL